jgi:hypothetical protein
MIVGNYPCPQCSQPVAAMPGQLAVCPHCAHEFRPRPSTLDHIWFGQPPYVNPLVIFLAMEKWCSRGWAESAGEDDVDGASDWTEALVDIIALRHSGKPGRHSYATTRTAHRMGMFR